MIGSFNEFEASQKIKRKFTRMTLNNAPFPQATFDNIFINSHLGGVIMTEGNKQFLYAVGSMIGINILINILPSPWGLLAVLGFLGHFVYQIYKQTRY